MYNFFVKSFLLVTFIFLTVCAAHGSLYSEQEQLGEIPKGYARVTLYRVSQFTGSLVPYSHCLNKTKIVTFGQNQYTHLLVEPGSYKFKFCSGWSSDYIDVTFAEGKDYYLRQGPPIKSDQKTPIATKDIQAGGMFYVSISMVENDFALDELKTFKYKKPKKEFIEFTPNK